MTTSGFPSRLHRWYRELVDEPTPLVKQLPTVLAMAAAVGLTAAIPDLTFISLAPALTGVGVVVIATVVAWVMSLRPVTDGWVVLLVPVADIIGIGLFRMGTGGTTSLFTSIVLLPVVWIATAPGFRYVLLVAGLTSFILLMPYFAAPPLRAVDWLRGVITPIVFGVVAAVVNELSRQSRARIADAERLAAERTELLTEKEQVLEQLSASEQQFRSMVDLYDSLWQSITKQAVIVTDGDGVITEWNPGAQRMLGLTQQQAVSGERIHRFITDDISAGLIADHPELAGKQDAVGILFALADADANVDRVFDVTTSTGTTLPARVTVVPFKDGAGAALGYLFVLSDETQAAEVARMKDQFVGMISHELRTPLSSIVGFVDLLQHDLDHPLTDEQLGFVAVIERNAQRLLTLVGDLLFTAQVESGRFPLEVSDTDIAAVVRAAVTSAGPHAAREGIDIVTRLPESPVRLEADAQRLGQAIDNLVSNALKFTPRGGTVTVAVEERDAEVVVSVRDTGMGIPADEQQKLFTRFFRASTATRNAVPGVGLGLTITRAIVHAHGGELQFESEEGVGTEFRMLLPVAPRTQPLLRVVAAPSDG